MLVRVVVTLLCSPWQLDVKPLKSSPTGFSAHNAGSCLWAQLLDSTNSDFKSLWCEYGTFAYVICAVNSKSHIACVWSFVSAGKNISETDALNRRYCNTLWTSVTLLHLDCIVFLWPCLYCLSAYLAQRILMRSIRWTIRKEESLWSSTMKVSTGNSRWPTALARPQIDRTSIEGIWKVVWRSSVTSSGI